MPVSVGTSLSTIVLTSIVSARKHYAKGGVEMQIVRLWWPAILLGVLIGSMMPSLIDGKAVKSVFGVMLVVVSIHMLISSYRHLQLADRLPSKPWSFLIAMLVGSLSSLLGIGGGTLVVPILSMFGVVIHRAVATASVFGLMISVPATLVYVLNGLHVQGLPPMTTGYVNWMAFIILVPMTMWMAPYGVKLAYRLNVPQLKRAFALFLFIVGLKMALV
jgi:uncharacterized membrane protein YfcA